MDSRCRSGSAPQTTVSATSSSVTSSTVASNCAGVGSSCLVEVAAERPGGTASRPFGGRPTHRWPAPAHRHLSDRGVPAQNPVRSEWRRFPFRRRSQRCGSRWSRGPRPSRKCWRPGPPGNERHVTEQHPTAQVFLPTAVQPRDARAPPSRDLRRAPGSSWNLGSARTAVRSGRPGC